MKKTYLLFPLIGAALLCGCGKQTKINGEKIQILSQNLVQFEQSQSRQMAVLQSQLTSLAPMLDRINNSYFEKNREDALFYHTNTLFLLLTMDKKIESQLQDAEIERASENSQAYYYHTNQTDTMYFCVTQIEDAMAAQENRIENEVNAGIKRANDELLKQIRLASPNAA